MGEKLRTRPRRRLRRATLVLGSCLVFCCFFFIARSPRDHGTVQSTSASPNKLPSELLRHLSLDEEQCRAAFPGLTKEIDDAVAEGPFALKQAGDSGPVQGRIKDGELYIIHAQRRADLSTEMLNSRTAALHQLHRALLTSPDPLPDTIFSLNFQDQPYGTAFAYSRPASAHLRSTDPDARNFLMPHFSFWSWPLPFIGSIRRAAAAIEALESRTPFASKTAKAVWRGTTWFNSVANPRLRQNLLKAARERTWDWADVQALQGGRANALDIEDFCRYKYVLHTEGVTYSGRFQFLQMCASVLITPPIEWLQHTTHLVRPVFSGDLLGVGGTGRAHAKTGGSGSGAGDGSELKARSKKGHGQADDGKKGWEPSESVRKAWPTRYAPEEANIVFVSPDWSDLEETVTWLEANPAVAEGIARRQRELFVGGGYFSPAAEACYWRALVRGWASVARTDGQGWEDQAGVPFEAFALNGGS